MVLKKDSEDKAFDIRLALFDFINLVLYHLIQVLKEKITSSCRRQKEMDAFGIFNPTLSKTEEQVGQGTNICFYFPSTTGLEQQVRATGFAHGLAAFSQ